MNRSTYTYTVEDGVICIVDYDIGKSVTNDAENVISDLVKRGLNMTVQPVIYRDTEGYWDAMEVTRDGQQFYGFYMLNLRDKEQAKRRVLELFQPFKGIQSNEVMG